MATLVILEHTNGQLCDSARATISAAQALEQPLDAILLGFDLADTLLASVKTTSGVRRILYANDLRLQHQLAEDCAAVIEAVAEDYTHIFAPATTFGKNLLPRVAALLDVNQISDVIEIHSLDTFTHPIYAGNALETLQVTDRITCATIRPTAFAKAELDAPECPLELVTLPELPQLSSFQQLAENDSDRPDLTSARVVVSGGRGLQSKENYKLIEDLADVLQGAVGASRAIVDAGFVPNDYQVGQTGKVVAPELYIAVGISGAIQHLAGMTESQVIVAINKDPEAPIFQVADYGLVGDLFTIVPELTEKLAPKS